MYNSSQIRSDARHVEHVAPKYDVMAQFEELSGELHRVAHDERIIFERTTRERARVPVRARERSKACVRGCWRIASAWDS